MTITTLFDCTTVQDRWPCHRDVCGTYWVGPLTVFADDRVTRRVTVSRWAWAAAGWTVVYEYQSIACQQRAEQRQISRLSLKRTWRFDWSEKQQAVELAGRLQAAIERKH
jgi:hypothetical protein